MVSFEFLKFSLFLLFVGIIFFCKSFIDGDFVL